MSPPDPTATDPNPAPSPASRLTARWFAVIALATLLYTGVHLAWYWTTPLGRAPVLDERENLALAAQIADGTLPAQPFYRAMGYPLLLAGLHVLGVSADAMPPAATALGGLLHLAAALLAAAWARKLFSADAAALLAGLAYGLNPVLIHEATQIIDGTLANVFFLAGGLALEHGRRATGAATRAAILTLAAWTLAALTRPQFTVLVLAFPLVWWLARPRLGEVRAIAAAALAAALLWSIPVVAQYRLSGVVALMPKQGAYNLWAANKPGADGRFYAQSVLLTPGDNGFHQNPAQAEANLLYERETGRPATDPDAVNAHWRTKTVDAVRADPGAWLRLMARKVYYLLNDAEPYNNKTYAFHKARSPALASNPLGWGLLLLVAAGGVAVLRARDRAALHPLAAVALVVAGGITLFFVSGRFRLPLAGLLCVLAGGAVFVPVWWRAASGRARGGLVMSVAALGVLTFSNLFGARSTATFVQDHLLIASAASRTGDDLETWVHSGEALQLAPGRADALAWRLTSFFNLLLADAAPASDERAWFDAALQALARPDEFTASARVIAGLACWRAGDRERAAAAWAIDTAEARAARMLAGIEPPGAPEVAPPAPPLVQLWRARWEKDARTAGLVPIGERLFTPTPPRE